MTPFGPFYCSLPLNPQPLEEGRRKTNARGFFAWFVWAYAPTTSEGWCSPSVGAASFRPRHLPFGEHSTLIRLRPAKAVRNHAKNPPSPPTTNKNKKTKKYRSFYLFWFKEIRPEICRRILRHQTPFFQYYVVKNVKLCKPKVWFWFVNCLFLGSSLLYICKFL